VELVGESDNRAKLKKGEESRALRMKSILSKDPIPSENTNTPDIINNYNPFVSNPAPSLKESSDDKNKIDDLKLSVDNLEDQEYDKKLKKKDKKEKLYF